jgi:dTDP-glucose 4,6-dehydratase
MTKWLVTGGCGFIGSNFILDLLARGDGDEVINLDALTYAGNLENLAGVEKNPRYRFVRGDIRDRGVVEELFRDGVDCVVNFAAESHVDRSIHDSSPFITTNVLGTQVLLDAAHRFGTGRFLHVSTDEVYGSLGPEGLFTEDSPFAPNSPYAASKAAADLLVRAFHHTFGLPTLVTRCSNNYGPYQFPEKLIPLFLTNALEDKPLPLYGDGLNVRDWIHVRDHCRGLLHVAEEGEVGCVYNIGGGNERTNLEITRLILGALGKPESLITYVKDRPGHDRRYAIDDARIRALGFAPEVPFAEGIEETVRWYLDNRSWWERIKTGEYIEYYDRQYGKSP